MVSQVDASDVISGLTDLNWKKVLAIGGIVLGIWAIWDNMDKIHNWIYKKPELISPASMETYENAKGTFFADGVKRNLGEENAKIFEENAKTSMLKLSEENKHLEYQLDCANSEILKGSWNIERANVIIEEQDREIEELNCEVEKRECFYSKPSGSNWRVNPWNSKG